MKFLLRLLLVLWYGKNCVMADQVRVARGVEELRCWLENMLCHHGYSMAERRAVTGLEEGALRAALEKFELRAGERPKREAGAPLLVLPYPGGRHPRIGFLDGAVEPQRETKLSIFTPW